MLLNYRDQYDEELKLELLPKAEKYQIIRMQELEPHLGDLYLRATLRQRFQHLLRMTVLNR